MSDNGLIFNNTIIYVSGRLKWVFKLHLWVSAALRVNACGKQEPARRPFQAEASSWAPPLYLAPWLPCVFLPVYRLPFPLGCQLLESRGRVLLVCVSLVSSAVPGCVNTLNGTKAPFSFRSASSGFPRYLHVLSPAVPSLPQISPI